MEPRLGVQSFRPGLIDPRQAHFRVTGPEGSFLSWCKWTPLHRALVGQERGLGQQEGTLWVKRFGKQEGSVVDWLDQKDRTEEECSAAGTEGSAGGLVGSSLSREKVAKDSGRKV